MEYTRLLLVKRSPKIPQANGFCERGG